MFFYLCPIRQRYSEIHDYAMPGENQSRMCKTEKANVTTFEYLMQSKF